MRTRRYSLFELSKIGSGNIPQDIVVGRVRKFISVHNAYKAKYVQTFLTLLNRSYWERSKLYGVDDLGNKWKSLAPRTHWIKNNEAMFNPRSAPQLTGEFTSPRQLSPQQLSEYQNKIKDIVPTSSIQGRAEKAQQRRLNTRIQKRALNEIYTPWHEGSKRGPATTVKYSDTGLSSDSMDVRVTPKMIRTGRLVSATAPGPIVNNRYYTTKDLIVIVDGPRIHLSLKNIPYAAEADKERPIIPEDTLPWELEAHTEAIKEAEKVYRNLLETRNR